MKATDWIKVEDRLPDKHLTPAMVFLKDGRYCIAWWFITERGGGWVDWFDMMDSNETYSPLWGNVTHWMPIELPKED